MRPVPTRPAAAAAALLLLSSCSLPGPGGGEGAATAGPDEALPTCAVVPRDDLVPAEGVLAGVDLDWGSQTLQEYSERLGARPSVAGIFAPLPMGEADAANVAGAVDQVRADGGVLLLSLDPHEGLEAVTEDVAADLAQRLDGYNRSGVPVILRFGHEMNGSWHPWGQQPQAYAEAFRRVAEAVHEQAPGTATLWAPNYGGGYPFREGGAAAEPGSPEHEALDTNGDGVVDGRDDPYAPYYPGDDVVDWVGLSLYHWGNDYRWGANVVPAEGKFAEQLTGSYARDDGEVPDFYAEYAEARGKPLAVADTAALFVPDEDGPEELEVKQGWWSQLGDPALQADFPQLKLVTWFEWSKEEAEVDGTIDWRALGDPEVAEAYAADRPDFYLYDPARPDCSSR